MANYIVPKCKYCECECNSCDIKKAWNTGVKYGKEIGYNKATQRHWDAIELERLITQMISSRLPRN